MTEKIGIASDHAGRDLKRMVHEFLVGASCEVVDFGVAPDDAASVDYPDFAAKVAEGVSGGSLSRGVLICGSGVGMSIAANKFPRVRAAVISDEFSARMSRMHNDLNVLCLGSRTVNHFRAVDWTKVWFETAFEGGRHAGRLQKISDIESANFKTSE